MEFQLTPIRPIARDASDTPTLQVVVDTEEEFDWGKPFNPASIAVRHMRRIERLQRICEPFGLHPTYVADFPVVSQADGFEPLKEVLADRVAQVGVHLHPWVNPPYEEKVCAKNSYPGNLPAKLEQSKLQRLMEAHEAAFGFRPDIYKAGRYGIGTNSIRTLRLLGFNIDMSVCSGFDFRRDGGPDFRGYPAAPWWWAEGLLEIPTSGAFVGWLHSLGPNLFSAINHPRLGWMKLPAVAARLRALDRLMLSPEGYSAKELERLTSFLLALGVRTFTFSLHSPSLEAGHTPYVRTIAEERDFLERCKRYFDFFFGQLGGRPITAHKLKLQLEAPV